MAEEQAADVNQPTPANQPGVVITPGTPTQEPPAPPAEPAAPDPEPPVQPPILEEPAAPPPAAPTEAEAEIAGTVTWTAPEFVAHDKSAVWYLGLAIVAVAFAALIYLLTKDVVSTVVIIVVAMIFGIYGRHKPRQISYRLDPTGITIGAKFHGYDEFKSFSAKPEIGLFSLTFTPLKRFAPFTTIYYSEQEEEKIMAVLGARLPYEEPRRDAVDSLMRRIRF